MCLFQEMPEDKKLIKRILTDHFKYHSNKMSAKSQINTGMFINSIYPFASSSSPSGLSRRSLETFVFVSLDEGNQVGT